jgi:hypothetical protein
MLICINAPVIERVFFCLEKTMFNFCNALAQQEVQMSLAQS